jgi:hypothetical protein
MLALLSEIEMNLHTRAVYIEEFDRIYESTLPILINQAEQFTDNALNQVVSALRRSKYF